MGLQIREKDELPNQKCKDKCE